MAANLYVGIDWADDHHDAHFTDDTDQMEFAFRFSNEIEGFQKLHQKIAQYQPDPAAVFVMIETPRGLLVHSLLQRGYQVYAINPKAAESYRKQTSTSGAKSDPADAKALARAVKNDRKEHRPLRLTADAYRLLGQHCHHLRLLNDQATMLSNQMTSALKEYYPQAVKLFKHADSAINLAFLKRFPNPQAVHEAGLDGLTGFLRAQHYPAARAGDLFAKASAPKPAPDPVIAQANEVLVAMLVDQMASLLPHRKKLERLIQEIFEQLPESNDLSRLPGLGPQLAPEIAAALGPADTLLERFEGPQQMACLSGCVPVTKRSGKSCRALFRFACDKKLRRTFYDWAFSSIRWCPWAKAFYQHHHFACRMPQPTVLRNLAVKWIKILFRLQRTGEQYDEAVHIAALKKHGVVWAAAL